MIVVGRAFLFQFIKIFSTKNIEPSLDTAIFFESARQLSGLWIKSVFCHFKKQLITLYKINWKISVNLPSLKCYQNLNNNFIQLMGFVRDDVKWSAFLLNSTPKN